MRGDGGGWAGWFKVIMQAASAGEGLGLSILHTFRDFEVCSG